MTATLTRALRLVLPNQSASAGCPSDCSYEYWCDSYHHYYRRQCCYRSTCAYYCGAYTAVGPC